MYDELLKSKADRIINDVCDPWGREFKATATGGRDGKRRAGKNIYIHEKLFTASVQFETSAGGPDFSQQVTVPREVWTWHIYMYI